MKYLIEKSDGTVSIMMLSAKADSEKALKSWEELNEKAVSFTKVKASDIPTDRTFRDAWKKDGKKVRVGMKNARKIHLNKIRQKRNEKLAELDIETMKGNDVQKDKQKLRDLPDNVDLESAKTPEDLKKVWPAELA